MKLLRKSMILVCMLVGIYFAADVSAASAGSSCYQNCSIQLHSCLVDRNCFDEPDGRFCRFCETRYESCINGCNYR